MISRSALPLRMAAIAAMGLVLLAPNGTPATAASVDALLLTAVHNTNTVRTMVHHDRLVTHAPGLSVKVNATGYEDEIHNREHDIETAAVSVSMKNAPPKKTNYRLEVIFANGLTYYRSTEGGNRWQTTRAKVVRDPFLGGWKRGRTTVTVPKNVTFRQIGSSAGGVHLQSHTTQGLTHITVDYFLTPGSKPYVTREVETISSTQRQKVTTSIQLDFGPFNRPITIKQPGGRAT